MSAAAWWPLVRSRRDTHCSLQTGAISRYTKLRHTSAWQVSLRPPAALVLLDSALISVAVTAGHHCPAVRQCAGSSVVWNQFHRKMGFSAIPTAERATTGHSGAMRTAGSASSRDITYMIHDTRKIAHKYNVTSSNAIVLLKGAAAARSGWAGGSRALHVAITLCRADSLARAIAHSVLRPG